VGVALLGVSDRDAPGPAAPAAVDASDPSAIRHPSSALGHPSSVIRHPSSGLPDRATFPAEPEDNNPVVRHRVAEVLMDLADRCGVSAPIEALVKPDPDPAEWMELVARGLRYQGPWLSEPERVRLAGDPHRDAPLALRWDALVRRFATDRPLPADFRSGPLRWQLAALAWSFHVEGAVDVPHGPRRSAPEAAQALADALALDFPLWPTPLAERYPALDSYRAFLGRLPRR
jgi:hypothetical protein